MSDLKMYDPVKLKLCYVENRFVARPVPCPPPSHAYRDSRE